MTRRPPGGGGCAEGGTPRLRVPSGPRGLLLRSTSALPGLGALGASVLPVQLDCLLFPELARCLPLQVLVPGICFRLECPFSHLFKSFLFKVPALRPAPPRPSPGPPPHLPQPRFPGCHCEGVPRVVSPARLCMQEGRGPSAQGPSVASSCPACPWGWGRLAWRGCTRFLHATAVVPVPRQGGQSHRPTLSAQAPCC